MRSQKGSVTVIALIMLLFLVIVGGAWTIMMTQEKTNAFADEKQQQAWYAAEAGYKRAAILLTRSKTEWVNNNTDWSWTTYDATKFKSKNESDLTKISLTDGSVITDATKVKTLPWYAVNVSQITDSTYARPTSGTTTYTITSIGEYMGERKVISREVTTKITGSSGGGGTVIATDTIVQAAGTVTVNNSVNTFGNNTDSTKLAKIATTSGLVNDLRGDSTSDGRTYDAQKITTILPTKVAASNFVENAYGTFTTLSEVTGWSSADMTLTAGSLTKISWPINWHYKDQWNDRTGVYGHKIVGNSGAILWVNLTGDNVTWGTKSGYKTMYFEQGIWGPDTTSSDEPLTLVFTDNVYINGEIHGKVRIISNGNVYLGNRPIGSLESPALLMVVANGNVTVEGGSNYAKMFISSNGNVDIESSGMTFTGQIQAAGNVILNDNGNVLDTTVATTFKMPTMEYN